MQSFPKWLAVSFGVLASILIICLIVTQIYSLHTQVSSAKSANKNTITITGTGKITARPDLATINASVINTASNAKDALSANTLKMNAVLSYLKSNGIADADITTSDLNVNPEYNYLDGNQNLTGYSANQTLTIKIHDFTKLGTLLSNLPNQGVNSIDGVDYSFNDIDSFREQAREQALGNAKDNAEKLAQAAGVTLGKLQSFSESSQNPVTPLPYAMSAGSAESNVAAAPVTQTEPGTQDITADVTVIYQIQ